MTRPQRNQRGKRNCVRQHQVGRARRLLFERLECRHLLAASPQLIKDINLQFNTSGSGPSDFVEVDGMLFFTANTATTRGGLWKSDGTEAGTVLVKDIDSGTGSSNPRHLTNVGGTLFFRANDGVHGEELWMSDGTEAGTRMVADIAIPGGSNPSSLTNVDGTLFFAATTENEGTELWGLHDAADTGFRIGDRVQATTHLNIRSTAGGTWIGLADADERGTITDGPMHAVFQGVAYVWYRVQWDNGITGWSVVDGLAPDRMVLDRKTLRLPAVAFDGEGSDLQLTLTGGGPSQWIHVQAGRHQSRMVPVGLFHNRSGTDPWTIDIDIGGTDLGWVEYIEVASTHDFEFGVPVVESDHARLLFRLDPQHVEPANAGTTWSGVGHGWQLYEYSSENEHERWKSITVDEIKEQYSKNKIIILTHGWNDGFDPGIAKQAKYIHNFVVELGKEQWPEDAIVMALDWSDGGRPSGSRAYSPFFSAQNGIAVGKALGRSLRQADIEPSNL